MMNIKPWILSLAFTFFFFQAFPQCDSSFFRNLLSGIRDISMVDTNNIVGVCENGTIVKTSNGGQTWINADVHNTRFLSTVQMASANIGYAGGWNRTILKTENGGSSWFPLFASTSKAADEQERITDLFFVNSDKGIVISDKGLVLRTEDGGANWKDTVLNFGEQLTSVCYADDTTVLISGSTNTVYKSVNSGATWEVQSIADFNATNTITKVRFKNSLEGIAVGWATCVKTVDGGKTWKAVNTGLGAFFADIFFSAGNKVFIVGSNPGVLVESNDGGDSWQPRFDYENNGVAFNTITGDKEGKKVITTGIGGRSILVIYNGGTHHAHIGAQSSVYYADVQFISEQTGFVGGDNGTVLKTSDKGETWTPLTRVPSRFQNAVSQLSFLDEMNGFAQTDGIYKTIDGGKTWASIGALPSGLNLPSGRVKFFDRQKGLIQNGGWVFQTLDGGDSWQHVYRGTLLLNMAIAPGNKVFGVGSEGEAVFSTDYGSSWNKLNLSTNATLTGVYFYNSQIGFIGSSTSSIFKTVDGGENWQEINIGNAGLWKRYFRFVSESVGFMIGNNGGGSSWIYKTTDGGLTWFEISNVYGDLTGFSKTFSVYTSGSNKSLLKLDTLTKPILPGLIYGPKKSCLNGTAEFITGKMSGVSYHWSLSGGGSITANQNVTTASWNNTGIHQLSLNVSNTCGVSETRTFAIEVEEFIPTITITDTALTATEGLTYQWYKNGEAIQPLDGGNKRVLKLSEPGTFNYAVAVKNAYGCTIKTPDTAVVVPFIVRLCSETPVELYASGTSAFYQWEVNDGSGFKDIDDNVQFSGTKTAFLRMPSAPSSLYGYRLRCKVSSGYSRTYVFKFESHWTGKAGSAWENPANWSCGKLPDAGTDVYVINAYILVKSDVKVRSIRLSPSSTLVVSTGSSVTITH